MVNPVRLHSENSLMENIHFLEFDSTLLKQKFNLNFSSKTTTEPAKSQQRLEVKSSQQAMLANKN